MSQIIQDFSWNNGMPPIFILIGVFFFGLFLAALTSWLLKRLSKRSEGGLSILLLKRCRSPLWILVPLLLTLLVVKYARIPEEIQGLIRHVLSLGLIFSFGWLLILSVLVFRDFILGKYDVRIRDNRRLVVPVTHFLQKPFQNWTRRSADILGTVFLYADYSIDVEAVRGELHQLLQASEKWDGKTWGLQVTNTNDKTIEMRALMSAPDASLAWDLRCDVREKLLKFLPEKFPESLTRIRAELASSASIKEV